MDISLHSFILVVGMIVIGFIIWDGVKKVRAARANRMEQPLQGYDDLDALSGEDDLPVFDDLEIKDELLHEDLADSEPEESIEFDKIAAKVQNPIQDDITKKPLFDVVSEDSSAKVVEAPLQGDKTQATLINEKPDESFVCAKVEDFDPQEEDGFEHFSAHEDDIALKQKNSAIAQATVAANQAKKLQETHAKSVLGAGHQSQAKSQTDKEVASKTKPQSKRISKEELAAQLAKAQLEAKQKAPTPKAEQTVPEIELDDKEPVPVLMEPVELGQKVDPNPPKQHELVLPEFIQQTLQDEPIFADVEEAQFDESKPDLLMEYIEDVQTLPVGEKLSEREAAQEIFVINILKQDGKGLQGRELAHIFKVCDMRHGEMNIFHRFEQANAQGKIQFSVTNAIEPGTFDLATIDELVTPGISLFMSLPGPEKPMEAFDAMAEVALVFSRNFNASLHDDTHSDLTPQTLEHYRNRVREFSRKHLSQKK